MKSAGSVKTSSAIRGPGPRGDGATPLLYIAVFRGWSSSFQFQVGSFVFPVVADLWENGGGKPQKCRLIWEGRGDPRSASDLLVEPLGAVSGSEPPPVGGRDRRTASASGTFSAS